MQDTERNDSKSKTVVGDILLIAIVVVIFSLFTLFGFLVVVEGDSMSPTLCEKDVLYIGRGNNISYGDIVVIDSSYLDKRIIKRVVAMEGDTIEIDGTSVFVNGVLLDEGYILSDWNSYYEKDIVPEGCVFVMGDNRGVSLDSRTIGYVDTSTILGVYKFSLFRRN